MEEVEGVEYLCSSLSVRHEHFVEMWMHVVRSSQCESRLYLVDECSILGIRTTLTKISGLDTAQHW